MALNSDLKVIARSWQRHFNMQFATLVVLSGTFSVVACMLCLSFNFQRVLSVWGEQVQISAYLEDGVGKVALDQLEKELSNRPEVASVTYISKEKAANEFREQMASYAPDLMSDAEFATPFPASFQIHLKSEQTGDGKVVVLEKLAQELKNKDGVEDVSYGQSWVRNYASFVGVIENVGIVVGVILLFGSIFIVANAIATLISDRKDEIEILELIGATARNIRRPYIFEGAMLCTFAAAIAILINAALYVWLTSIMKKSLAFARMAQEFQFFSPMQIAYLLLATAVLGGIGAWLTIRSLNDGWSAARGVRA